MNIKDFWIDFFELTISNPTEIQLNYWSNGLGEAKTIGLLYFIITIWNNNKFEFELLLGSKILRLHLTLTLTLTLTFY